jgi:glutaredoxin
MGKYVNKIIKYKDDNLYVVFYSSTCWHSMRLLNYLKSNKIDFKGYDVNVKPGRFNDLLADLNANSAAVQFDTTHRTKPIVFYKGKYIGGATETINLLESSFNMII